MNVLRQLRLSPRLSILIGIFVLGFVVSGAWALKTLDTLQVNGPVYQRIVQGKDLIADVLPPPEYIIESYLVALQLRDAEPAARPALVERLRKLKGEFDTRHDFWQKEHLDPQAAELMLRTAYGPAMEFYRLAFEQFEPAIRNGDAAAAASAMQRMGSAYEAHRQAIDRLVPLVQARIDQDEREAREQVHSSTVGMLAAMGVSLAAAVLMAVMVARTIIQPLRYAVRVAQGVAAGELTTRILVRFKDEPDLLLAALKEMNDSLRRIVGEVRAGTDSIASTSSEIAKGNDDLSGRTERQASALQQTAASMEQLTSTVRLNGDNARQADTLAREASDVAVRGGKVVAEVVQTMESINASSRKVEEITSVIDGIAFQTNILALNAAVEAARAGEQGRGFAVVASEVRELAQRSAAAAREIKALIGTSVAQVDAGSALVARAGSTMQEVVASVQRVTDIIGGIAAASEEQITGLEQINAAVVEMDGTTQQNAAMVEQAAAAATALRNAARMQAELVRTFKLGENDAAGAGRMPLLLPAG